MALKRVSFRPKPINDRHVDTFVRDEVHAGTFSNG